MPAHTEVFHKETLNQTYWTCFKEHNVFCTFRGKIYLGQYLSLESVTLLFPPHLKWVTGNESRAEHPNFPRPPAPQWSQEGAFVKQPNVLWGRIRPLLQWAQGSGNNWHSTVASRKEQLPLLPQPPHTPTKPTVNTLWHWQSSSSLNKAFAPGKAGNILHYFMAVVGALQLNRARGTFPSTALMCWEGHRHFATLSLLFLLV